MTLDRKLIKVVLLTGVFVYRVGKNPLVADGGGANSSTGRATDS